MRDAKESVSCEEVSVCEMVSRRSGCRRCSLNGGVSYKACHRRRAMSPCPVEYSCISGCSGISCSSSRAEASFGSVVSGPVGQWLAGRQDQSPCDRGSIVVCTKRDCRLVVGPSGCDDVVGRCRGKAKAQLVLFHLVWRANEKCLSHVVWLLVSGWKRGPLAPVVVGEGQVNLVYGRRL